jgi:hypothetical protein
MKIKNVLRFILLILVLLILIFLSELVLYGIGYLINKLSNFWFWFVIFSIGGGFFSFFELITALLVILANYISPYKKLNMITIIVFSIIHLIYNIYFILEKQSSIGIAIAAIIIWTIINGLFAFKAFICIDNDS